MPDTFDPQTLKLDHTFETPGILFALCRDRATEILYGAGTDGAVYRVDPQAEKPAAEKSWTHHENYVSSLVWWDGQVISAGFDRRIVWTRADTGERLRDVTAHDGWVRKLALLPEARVASVGDDMLVKLWDARTGELIRTLDGHARKTPEGYPTALYALTASTDGKWLASGDRIGEVCVWEVESGRLLTRLKAPAFYTFDAVKRARAIGGIRTLCFSADGSRLAIGGIGQVTNVDGFVGPCRVEIWDWQAAKTVFVGQDPHQAILNHVTFHPTAPWLVAAGGGDGGGVIAFWNQSTPAANHKTKPKGHLQHFVTDPPGRRLFAAGFNGFQFWSTP